MTQESGDVPLDSGSKDAEKAKDRKSRNRPLTKVVVRRLPPCMSLAEFLEQVSPIPEYDYIHFSRPDMTLGSCAFSRAYINFVNYQDIFLFRDKFDGYVFIDDKGVEYTGLVDFAPFQRIPKKRKKKDPKCGTIESDPAFQEFLECLKEPERTAPETKLEYSYQFSDNNDKQKVHTPLLDYLNQRRSERKMARDERRRRGDERRQRRLNETIQEEESPENDSKKASSESEKKKDDKPTRRERRQERAKKDKETKKSDEVTKKSFKDDEIKPFTQLPQVKDYARIIDGMEKIMKINEKGDSKDVESEKERSSERDELSESNDGHAPRRIRNKDRPSLAIYQPGMGKFSKTRIPKDKELTNNLDEKDT